MRKWYIRLFILIAYCIPYAFLAIYGDAIYRTMLLYGVMAVAFFVLYRLCIRSHNVVVFFHWKHTEPSCFSFNSSSDSSGKDGVVF